MPLRAHGPLKVIFMCIFKPLWFKKTVHQIKTSSMFHSTSWDLQPHISQKAHSRIPSKVQQVFSAACSASAWVLTVVCIQLCVLLNFLTQNSILIWPKLPVSGSSSMMIYTETIQSDLSAVAYISMLLMCSSPDERMKTCFQPNPLPLTPASVLLARTTVELLWRCFSPQISYRWEKCPYLSSPFSIPFCLHASHNQTDLSALTCWRKIPVRGVLCNTSS